MKDAIAELRARRIFDSRGRPTIEVDVILKGGALGRAAAPAGASRGSREAIDLRDGGAAFGGLDVKRALAAVRGPIAAALLGRSVEDQAALDDLLVQLDGTPNKSRLGGNAIVATSMAVAKARASSERRPLWLSLADDRPVALPLPEIQIFGGGAHAGGLLDVQDFMVVPLGAETFSRALEMTAEIYRCAGDLLAETGRLAGVADEGGFWPVFETNEAALEALAKTIERAGFRPFDDVGISLDLAATQFRRDNGYRLAREDRALTREEWMALLLDWTRRYPIVSVEDPLAEDDDEGLAEFTAEAGARLQVVGDDFLVTSADRIREAQKSGACNAALIKPNQVGTLTEARDALSVAHEGGWGAIVSARSGETEDTTIVHLAVGWGAKQIKVGSFSRSERMAKWNEGLRIAEEIGAGGDVLPLRSAFPWGAVQRLAKDDQR